MDRIQTRLLIIKFRGSLIQNLVCVTGRSSTCWKSDRVLTVLPLLLHSTGPRGTGPHSCLESDQRTIMTRPKRAYESSPGSQAVTNQRHGPTPQAGIGSVLRTSFMLPQPCHFAMTELCCFNLNRMDRPDSGDILCLDGYLIRGPAM